VSRVEDLDRLFELGFIDERRLTLDRLALQRDLGELRYVDQQIVSSIIDPRLDYLIRRWFDLSQGQEYRVTQELILVYRSDGEFKRSDLTHSLRLYPEYLNQLRNLFKPETCQE
jgi:hypothetical protein